MEKSKDLQIYCLGYKPYDYMDDEYHTPLQCGKDVNPDVEMCELCDNIGDNISKWNPWMVETTGIYWIWKNVKDVKYLGHEQYRRRWPIDCTCVEEILKSYDIIVPKVKVFPMTIESHYGYAHNIKDLQLCEAIIKKLYPEMGSAYDKIIKIGKSIYTYNSFITTKENYDDICGFLFTVLLNYCKIKGFNTKEEWIAYATSFNKNVPLRHKDVTQAEYQSRVCGYLSERLLTFYFIYKFQKRFECEMLPLEQGID